MMTNDTLRKISELKLIGMAHAFPQQVESANALHLSFEERIGLLIDYEVTYRDDRRLHARPATAWWASPAKMVRMAPRWC